MEPSTSVLKVQCGSYGYVNIGGIVNKPLIHRLIHQLESLHSKLHNSFETSLHLSFFNLSKNDLQDSNQTRPGRVLDKVFI
jgi:hypothetical protein